MPNYTDHEGSDDEQVDDQDAVEHASMSDGESDLYNEGFDIRDGPAELADDLEAVVQAIAAVDILGLERSA